MAEVPSLHRGLLGRRISSARIHSTAEKKVLTMSTPLALDWFVEGSDWPGFRMFPLVPSVYTVGNPVRVPPRAQYYRRSARFGA